MYICMHLLICMGVHTCVFLRKPSRCNPDVAPRLTSGGYEDEVDVITPINILFIRGNKF